MITVNTRKSAIPYFDIWRELLRIYGKEVTWDIMCDYEKIKWLHANSQDVFFWELDPETGLTVLSQYRTYRSPEEGCKLFRVSITNGTIEEIA